MRSIKFTSRQLKLSSSFVALAIIGVFLAVGSSTPRAQDNTDTGYGSSQMNNCESKASVLSGRALRDEILRYGDSRKDEINELKKLKAEIVEARIALRAEVEILETRMADAARLKAAEEEKRFVIPETRIEKKKRMARLAENRLRMSKAFRGMEAKDAARLIARLESGLAAELLRLMRPADAGKILAALPSRKAAALAAKVAGKDRPPKQKSKKAKKRKKPGKQPPAAEPPAKAKANPDPAKQNQ